MIYVIYYLLFIIYYLLFIKMDNTIIDIERMSININENHDAININNLSLLSKKELLIKCNTLGITKYISKNKVELINLIKLNILNNNQLINLTDVPLINLTAQPISHKLKPLIKWSGGKSDEIKLFEKYFPAIYDTYIEPFIGGGAVYFYLNPSKAVITDVHTELIDLYNSIKSGYINEIYNFMQLNNNNEDTYYQIRDNMKIYTELDNAKRFYYQRKTCFRGMLRYNKNGKFNIPYGKYKSINYSDLQNKKYEELLKKTEIINTSFEYVFENYNNENNFMFLDPPYDSEFTDYGYCKFGKDEHIKLAECFKHTRIKCLMIIGKTTFISELYKDYIVDEYSKQYKFKLYAGRVGDEINTKHLIIKNY